MVSWSLNWPPQSYRGFEAHSGKGVLTIGFGSDNLVGAHIPPIFDALPGKWRFRIFPLGGWRYQPRWRSLGFSLETTTESYPRKFVPGTSRVARGVALALPYWFIISVTGILPLLWTTRFRKKDHAAALCPRCGYDVRATPGQCPECGIRIGISAAE
jgi:hypothetical protein